MISAKKKKASRPSKELRQKCLKLKNDPHLKNKDALKEQKSLLKELKKKVNNKNVLKLIDYKLEELKEVKE